MDDLLQEPFDILGYFGDEIFFRYKEKTIVLNKRLPKTDLVLYLKVEPEDVKALQDEILVEASRKPLTYDQKTELLKEKT